MENIKKMKNTMLKIKNTQNEFNSRLDTIDAKISELEDTTETIQKCNTNRKKIEKKKKEQSINEL